MNYRLIIPTAAMALATALPALAQSEVTGSLMGGTAATSSGGALGGTVATSSQGGGLSGTVVSPTTTTSGGGSGASSGGGAGSIGITAGTNTGTGTGSVLGTSTPGSVLGTTTPGLPNTGAGGDWIQTMLALITSAGLAISGIAYLRRYRT